MRLVRPARLTSTLRRAHAAAGTTRGPVDDVLGAIERRSEHILTFVGILSRSGPVPPGLLAHVDSVAPRALAFAGVPYARATWVPAQGTGALWAWTNEPNPDPMVASSVSALVLSGDAPGSMHELARGILTEPTRAVRSLRGAWAVCSASEGRLTAATAITRVEPVYIAETDEAIVVGNRALLVHLIASRRTVPSYDPASIAAFLNAGIYACETTPFEGVRVMPPNAVLEATPERTTIRALDDSLDIVGSEAPTPARVSEVRDALVASIADIRWSEPITADLTGGRDSRLIIAALRDAGVPMRAQTFGDDDHPDVVVARRVAETLGIPHTVTAPARSGTDERETIEVDLLQRASSTLLGSDGMISAYENFPAQRTFDASRFLLAGSGGELLRGGYAKELRSNDEAGLDDWFDRTFFRAETLLHPPLLEAHRRVITEWRASQPARAQPIEIADRFYLAYRTGRWAAVARAGTARASYVRQPLFDHMLIKALRPIECNARFLEMLHFDLLKSLAPELVRIPFAGYRWRFESEGPSPGREEGWHDRAPVTMARGARASFNWKAANPSPVVDAFREQILDDDRAKGLFDVIDRDAMASWFLPDGSVREMWKVWRVYTASVLVSNRWLEDPPPSRRVVVEVRSAGSVKASDPQPRRALTAKRGLARRIAGRARRELRARGHARRR